MESHFRSILKAVTYRFLGLFVTVAVAWMVTHDEALATKIGLADTVLKIFAYYFHERIWGYLPFGRKAAAEYEI
jgi:uncharacterized membrane protein